MAASTQHLVSRIAVVCIAGSALLGADSRAESQQDFLVFPSLEYLENFDESDDAVRDSGVLASGNFLYSYTGDRWRAFGEYLWSSTESEMERLQFGWTASENTTLWLGRFHIPARHWISEFHHGQYMQTSITRPSLEEWEDESGSTPSHVTGLLLESARSLRGESQISYAISGGLGPKFVGDELVAYDVLDPDSGHGMSVNLKFGFRPEMFSPLQAGLLASWSDINVESPLDPAQADLEEIEQYTLGVYADWRWQDLRLLASVLYINNELKSPGASTSDDFILSYFQPEYEINEKFTLFGRVDIGFGEDQSPFLRMLPAFVAHRNMIGARWDFANQQALTIELADASTQGDGMDHESYKEVRLQWSAVFP